MSSDSLETPFNKNPYVVGRPVPPMSFIGRASEIETAFDQILNRSNLAVWGGPGIGKSSFLELLAASQAWKLRGHDPEATIVVLFSCLSLQPFTAAKFWREIFLRLEDELEGDSELRSEVTQFIEKEETTKDCLRNILRQIGKRKKFLLLLVDDYDVALVPNEGYNDHDIAGFLGDCRNLASHSKEREFLSMVVTSLRRLNELGPKLQPNGSPWYNHYLFQPLKPFSEKEVAAILGGLPMTPALQEGIHDIADGNPALLQNAGFLLFRELRSGRVPSAETFANDFQSATEHYFEDVWNLSNEVEQTLLMLLALISLKGHIRDKHYDLSGVDIIFSQKERELTDLEERGVISYQVQEGKRVYQFASSLMEWWVVKEIENSNEEELHDRQKVFLNLMSHRQAEIVTKAIRWLWEHKSEVPSILTWLGKLTSALPKGFLGG